MAPVTLAAHGSGLQEHPRAGASQGITPALSVQGWASLCQGTGAAASPSVSNARHLSPAAHCWSPAMDLCKYSSTCRLETYSKM